MIFMYVFSVFLNNYWLVLLVSRWMTSEHDSFLATSDLLL